MKLVNPPLGNMSGSLGGLTFRTQKGQTVVSAKKLGRPIKSPFQELTSQIQIEVMSNWGEVDEINRDAWEAFATGNFKPRKKTNSGTASGFNAFFSLNATAKKYQAIQIESTLTSNDVVLNSDPTNQIYTTVITPPTSALTTTIKTTAETDNIQLALTGVERVGDIVNFTLEITTTSSTSYELELPLQDSNSNPIAFSFYSSPAKNSKNQKSNKKFNSILFSTSPTIDSTSSIVENSIVLSVSIDDLKKNVPSRYNLDKFIDIGFCVNSLSGAVQYVNNLTVQVRDIYETPSPYKSKSVIAYPSYTAPYALLYDSKSDTILDDIWNCDHELATSAISEKYIAFAGNYQTSWNSSLKIYNKLTNEMLNYLPGFSATISKLWINDNWLYVRPTNPVSGYPILFRINLTTGNIGSCPPIDNGYIRNLYFSGDYVYVCGTSSIYSGQSIFKMHEFTGNTENLPYTTSTTYDYIIVNESKNVLILVQGEITNGVQEIVNLTTGALLDSVIASANGTYGCIMLGDYIYTALKSYVTAFAMNMKTNLDTFAKTKPVTNYVNGQNWQTISQGKIYSAALSRKVDGEYFGIMNETTQLWEGITTMHDYTGYQIAGIP